MVSRSSSDDVPPRVLELERSVTTLVEKVSALVDVIYELKGQILAGTLVAERAGVAQNAERASVADRAERADVADRAERADVAGVAERATVAERAQTTDRLDEIMADVETIKKEMALLTTMANRWKGGFIMLVALGGIIGWALTSWEHIAIIFRGGK